jgi:protein-S-isoprenylcysteine O-methyltransferase Ste14
VTRPAPASSSRILRGIARWRVPLGFLAAAAAFWLARPTRASLLAGGGVAAVGEAIRVWAAGHLEKSREVTSSGPYRWTRHPLYVGSTLIGVGLAIAAADRSVALLVAVYLATTIPSAVRTEEAYLRERFGEEYEAYASGRRLGVARRFSLERVLRNKEYRAVTGLAGGLVILAAKLWHG